MSNPLAPKPYASVAAFLLLVLLLPGCGSLRPGRDRTYVWVTSKGTYLRDRVAAISNHVEDVQNGEKLEVLQHSRRFYQLRTPDGKVGWIEEHSVTDQAGFDQFEALRKAHERDTPVATAVLRDVLFLHVAPGRTTPHFYLLPANDHLHLLVRASIPKPLPPQALLTPRPFRAARPRIARPHDAFHPRQQNGSTIWAESPAHPDPAVAPDLDPAAPWMSQLMEDWWLIRDSHGHAGWVLARRLDVDVPDEVAQYSEGRRMVGAYLLNTVMDNGERPVRKSDEERAKKKAAATARMHRYHPGEEEAAAQPAEPPPTPHPVGQWVTVTTEWKDGLPYDWNQVRVFIWNLRKHRYETAYRLRLQQGYLPVTIGKEKIDKMGVEPTFTIRTTPDGVVTQDENGIFHPKTVVAIQYRLEGGIVRRDTPLPPRPGDDNAPGDATANTAVAHGAGHRPAGRMARHHHHSR